VAQLQAEGTRSLVPQRLVVPAYFHPALHPDHWESLAEHAARVKLVILNLADGPGSRPDTAFGPALDRLRGAGVTVAGYVDTNYGRRPVPEALADLSRYLEWYGVGAVCFDRAAAGVEHLGQYGALASGAREMGAGVVLFNHGTHPAEAYAEHADVLGTFEGPWHAYRRFDVPRWTRSWPAGKFCHVVYSVPREHFDDAFALAVRRRAASVYVTDRGGGNPYDRLPAAGIGPRAAWTRG
jgi:Spherulation-specific family 4